VRDLGGPDNTRESAGRALTDSAVSHRGYFYFGAARDLPGVAELLAGGGKRRGEGAGGESAGGDEDDRTPIEELLRRVGAADGYYGVEDEELARIEKEKENRDQAALVAAWEAVEGNAALEDGPEWDEETIAALVGRPPATGQELDNAIGAIELAKSKLQFVEEVFQSPK
jgi:Isy1-like splicing family